MDSLNRHEDYGQEALDETHLGANPIEQLKLWLLDAEAEQLRDHLVAVAETRRAGL